MATRAALRTFPAAAIISNGDPRDKMLALLTARAILISGVYWKWPTLDIRTTVTTPSSSSSSESADMAAFAAASAYAAATTYNQAFSAAQAQAAILAPRSTFFTSAAYKDAKISKNDHFASALWQGDGPPPSVLQNQARFEKIAAEDGDWTFWLDWFRGFLNGEPLDWKLQKNIAQIPDEDWATGPAHISGEIEKIRNRHELETEIAAQKEQLTVQRATIEQRSHNKPPGLVDEHNAVVQQFTIIRDHLTEIEREIAEAEPLVARLRELLTRTLAYANAFAVYCVSLGDVALKKAAEEVGTTGAKWVIRISAGYFIAQTQPVQSGLQAIAELLKRLIQLF